MGNNVKTRFNRGYRLFAAILALTAVSSFSTSAELPSYLPRDAKPEGSLRLCAPPGGEMGESYACRDYRASDGVYSLLFQGGTIPRAMLHLPLTGEPVYIQMKERRESWTFDLPQPTGIPQQVRHVGTGVCTDSHDRFVPCAVFLGGIVFSQ